MGPGATVGTPGLGYPLLLCLGKSLVVILNYIQAAGPLRSGVLFSQQRSEPVPTVGKGPETPRVPEETGTRAQAAGAPDLPRRPDPRGVPDPSWFPDPLYSNRTPHRGKKSAPRVGVVWRRHVSPDMAVWVSILTFTHHCIYCGRWTSALIWQKLRRFIDQGTLLIAYYQGSGAAGAAHTASASLP